MKRLVLFDIDGTLISTHGLAKESFAQVLEQAFGFDTPARNHSFAGKTDRQIYHEVMALTSVPFALVEEKSEEVFEAFFSKLEAVISLDNITIHEGVYELLAALEAQPSVTLALLTGNMKRGAKMKLTPPGLFHRFAFGAFGDDAVQRRELPDIAVDRAFLFTGNRFTEKEIVVIGDTPNDIQCGRHLNVRTIAVATGGADLDTLARHDPDYLFPTLADTANVLASIFEECS
jgi:phosphoglycolate phosphatase